jgi:endo-1,4-beta-xylanase
MCRQVDETRTLNHLNLKQMKTPRYNLNSRITLLASALFAFGATAYAADTPATLKDAFKDHFYVGVAINRTIAMNAAVRADNVNRNMDQITKDIALAKTQFNQIVPENDTKWQLIHPRPGPDGYDFAPADAFVNFGLSNNMYLVGHTLVWHSQTPGWVFASTNSATYTNALLADPAGGRGGRGGGGGFGGGGFGRGGGAPGEQATREELLQRLHDHIATVVGRYKGKIKVWDVVNEAIDDGGTNILRRIASGSASSGLTSSPRPSNSPTKRTRMRFSATMTTAWRIRENAPSSSS